MDLQDGHLRDLLIAGVVVGGILLGLFLYTGNWPPPVVVESNSMMHVDPDEYNCKGSRGDPTCQPGSTRAADVPFGRFGTIDPGDLVLVKEIDSVAEVETFAQGGEEHYGLPGEVIVYYTRNQRDSTPIIHRAMTFVDRDDGPSGTTYTVQWAAEWEPPESAESCDLDASGRGTCTFGSEGVEIDELGLQSPRSFQHSGFITKGDNVVGNFAADQRLSSPRLPSEPVEGAWIQGVARGELPWFGLIKLSLTGPIKNAEMSSHDYFWTIGSMAAPKDLWVMLFVGLGVVALAPVGVDYAIHRYREPGESTEPDEPGPPPPGPRSAATGLDPANGREPDPAEPAPSQDPSDPTPEEDEETSGSRVDIEME